jgi:ADP-dependent NAD(P)H-hydrate dehydratase / NAD(P)H-hydrate epimerase
MQNIFDEVGTLDRRCCENFGLSEDILMEHAAEGMAQFIKKNFSSKTRILISCGGGNNGADGMALARLLFGKFDVFVYMLQPAVSPMAKLQFERIRKLGVPVIQSIDSYDIVIDALFGTGLTRPLDAKATLHVEALNALEAVKIACDVPTGLYADGRCDKSTFVADYTLTMGALKTLLFGDGAKDRIGEIHVLDLGVQRGIYETESNTKLLEFCDMRLPHRFVQDSHKGSFGHLGVISGEKPGAGILAASAALRFGVALVTLVSNETLQIPYELMLSHQLPTNATAVALGMGLGTEFSQEELECFVDNDLPLLLDADIFYHPLITRLLERKNIVLTPHPKEFVQLLHVSGIAGVDIRAVQQNRFAYAKHFIKRFPHAVLVLKGANVIVASGESLYVNPHGSNVLAKGGSGDVLGGLIASLLAQGYSPLQAACSASLAHTKLAQNFTGSDFSLTPQDLIEGICSL